MTPPTPHPYPVKVALAPKPFGILKSLQVSRRNLLELIPEAATRQPVVSGNTGTRWHMVTNPAALRHILLEALDDYPKSDVTKNILRPAIGDSLFVAEGDHWRWQRRTAAPAFSYRNVTALSPIMSAAAEASAARIAKSVGRAANLFDEMVAATFQVISDVTFSDGTGVDRQAVHRAIDSFISKTGKLSVLDIVGIPTWVPRPSRLLPSRAMDRIKRMSDAAIDARRREGPHPVPDLLDLLLEGADPQSHRRMTTAELRDNLLTFIVAGHETTALTLAWALYLCAFDQSVQDRGRAEARSVLRDRTATAADIPALPYIRQIVDETLRLYPPAAILSRTAQKSDTICGTRIAAGDTVTLPIYALHRSHLLWSDPDRFDPDRFADSKKIDRFAYLPFGAGPRICIGASFAVQEAVIVLATLLARFAFAPVAGRNPKPVMILTLRPQGGVWLRVDNAPR